jgi:hypothetical protein
MGKYKASFAPLMNDIAEIERMMILHIQTSMSSFYIKYFILNQKKNIGTSTGEQVHWLPTT